MRGLSRNEDDFYGATGQELTLLWHAPYYVTSPMILAAGARAGYRYVSGDVTVLDWVTAAQERMMPGLYRDAAGLVEDIAAAVVFLASSEAGWVTGQTIHVNGGMAMI